MDHIHRKHRLSISSEIAFSRLFAAFGMAVIDTVWALYMDSFGLSDSAIGFITAVFVLLSIIAALISTPLLEKLNENRIIIWSLITYIAAYLAMSHWNNLYVFLVLAGLLTVAAVFGSSAFDITFRDNTPDKYLNKEEGFLYSLLNIGWLIGPFIAGFFMARWGIESAFQLAAGFFAISLIIFSILRLPDVKKKRKSYDRNIYRNLIDFLRNKDLRLPYFMAMGIEYWWALIYIYVPLFMINNGLRPVHVGFFIGAVALPLVLFEFAVGKMSKKKGLKFFFSAGFGGLAILSAILFFVNNIVVALVLLAFASIFASMIEPLQDTFFFKKVNELDEEKYFPIFGSSEDAGSFLGKISIACVVLFLPEKYAYLITAVFMLIFTVVSLRIRE